MIRHDKKGRIAFKAADKDIDIFGYGEDEIRFAYDDENNGVYRKTTSSDGKEEITITFYDSDNKVKFERFISRNGHVDTHHIYLDKNVEIIIKKPLDGKETITILKDGIHVRSINIFENEMLLNKLVKKGAETGSSGGK